MTGGGGAARLTRRDFRILLALTAVAFLLRLLSPIMPDFITRPLSWPPVRAYGLGHPFQSPDGYIFDEVYFAKDACRDLVGMDYLDPEPPLAKLVIAAGMVVAGTWMHYDQGADIQPHQQKNSDGTTSTVGGRCESAGTLPGFGTWGWRLSSLMFGTALVPLIYLLALRLMPDRFFAASAAFLMSFDGMSFVQSRIAMIDAVALALLIFAYWAFHLHRDSTTDRAWWRTGLLLALALGLSVAAKWTTLAALGTMLLVLGGGWLLRYMRVFTPGGGWSWGRESGSPRAGPPEQLVRAYVYVLLLLLIPVIIYAGSYFRYNSIPQCSSISDKGLEVPANCTTGHGPAPALRLSHLGPVWVPSAINMGDYIHQIVVHDQWAYDYHAHLTATHTYGSAWYSWPLLLRPVAYYYQDNVGSDGLHGAPLRAEVFNLGNPAIWWASIPALIFCAVYAVLRRSYPAAFIVIAFLAAWLPFSRVTRVLFLYHMFGGLPFMILAVAFSLSQLRRLAVRLQLGSAELPTLRGTHLALGYLGLVLIVFLYFYPLWTGLPISGDSWNQRIWLNLPTDTKISWI